MHGGRSKTMTCEQGSSGIKNVSDNREVKATWSVHVVKTLQQTSSNLLPFQHELEIKLINILLEASIGHILVKDILVQLFLFTKKNLNALSTCAECKQGKLY